MGGAAEGAGAADGAADGAGAASRHSLGTAVCFGMLSATVLGVFVIPLLYVLVEGLRERVGRLGRRKVAAAPLETAAE